MPEQPTVIVTIELPTEQAAALAQFVKRAHFGTCERLSDPTKKDEPAAMMAALINVQHGLYRAGFAPR